MESAVPNIPPRHRVLFHIKPLPDVCTARPSRFWLQAVPKSTLLGVSRIDDEAARY